MKRLILSACASMCALAIFCGSASAGCYHHHHHHHCGGHHCCEK